MKILGIQLGHNSTVAILQDGKITHAVSQEKFDNKKNSSNFPKEAIEWFFNESGITPEEINYIAICGKFIFPNQLYINNNTTSVSSFNKKNYKDYVKYLMATTFPNLYWKYLILKNNLINKKIKQSLLEQLSKVLNLKIESIENRIIFVRHHTCHAYSAYYSCLDRKKPALILTLDGSGDYSCSTVSIYNEKNKKIERIASTPWLYSPGYVYSEITRFLGMKPLEHEYKVMGLSPYSKYEISREICDKIFKPLLWIDKDGLTFKSSIPTNRLMYYFKDKLLGMRFDNIAGGLQLWLEELVIQWIKNAIKITGIKNIYLGGGVFMNVKLNKKIMEMEEIEGCYFMPSCGDESNPFGACFYVYKTKTDNNPEPLKDLYLGPEYSDEEIKLYFDKNKLHQKYNIEYYDDIEKKVATLLSEFKIVARFKGRAEWGARALGNRSILANPSDLKSFYEVNDTIKQRDFWMPFAPSILDEDENKYIINPKKIKAPYMIVAFDSTELAQQHLKAAMHQADKTLRPQIVYRSQNPDYWRLIKYFKEITGIGGVLNTSLNLHGYPLVATLDQLLFTLENSKLKYAAVGNYLISKK